MANVVRTLPTPLSLADFDVGVTLGTGSFGRVRFSTHKVRDSFSSASFFIARRDFIPTPHPRYIFSTDDRFVLGYQNAEEGGSDQTAAGKILEIFLPHFSRVLFRRSRILGPRSTFLAILFLHFENASSRLILHPFSCIASVLKLIPVLFCFFPFPLFS